MKSVVQKNPQIPALGGVLIKEGYAIAANGEMTIQVKLEGAESESFIVPMKAFDLIKIFRRAMWKSPVTIKMW